MNVCLEEKAKIFKAFCDENRLQIIHLLIDGEKCACKLIEETNMIQSRLSYHMKILTESGVVKARQAGKWTYYSINNEGIISAMEYLEKLIKGE